MITDRGWRAIVRSSVIVWIGALGAASYQLGRASYRLTMYGYRRWTEK